MRNARAYVLTGPTASGKSDLAHQLALRHGLPILSADSMLIYRGMDAGTAKPSEREQKEVRYYGLNLVDPDQSFSVGDFLDYVRDEVPDTDIIVAGGTGLYLKCLLQGLAPVPPADPALRREADAILEHEGLPALLAWAQQRAPEALDRLADRQNPRRIIRAIERSLAPGSGSSWQNTPEQPVVGLSWERAALSSRIEQRVRHMLDHGLIEEAQTLLQNFPSLSPTASQAIGYRESFDMLAGRISRDEAAIQIAVRTRHLAKRQMTWFRHQLDVRWIELNGNATPSRIIERVWALWQELPPVHLCSECRL